MVTVTVCDHVWHYQIRLTNDLYVVKDGTIWDLRSSENQSNSFLLDQRLCIAEISGCLHSNRHYKVNRTDFPGEYIQHYLYVHQNLVSQDVF